MRHSRFLFVLALLPLLAACGPRTLLSMLAPTRYTVESTVVFKVDGRLVPQTLAEGCTSVDQTDSVGGGLATGYNGEHHWLKRADGSILVLGDLHPCRFLENHLSADHERLTVSDPRTMRYAYSQPSLLFDNAAAPTRVDVLSTIALMTPAQGLVADGDVRLVGGESTSGSLKQAFPALKSVLKTGTIGSGWGSLLTEPGFSGLTTRVYQMAPGTTCETKGEGLQFLPVTTDCRFINDCDKSGPNGVCGTELGGLRVTASATFDRLTIADPATPDPLKIATLWSNQTIAARTSQSGPRFQWAPMVCIEGVCGRPDRGHDGLIAYSPKTRILVMADLNFMQIARSSMFGAY